MNNGFQEDRVVDFQIKVDKIDLRDTGVDNWSDLFNAADGDFIQQSGSTVVIHTTDKTSGVLLNMQVSSLGQTDFLF